MSNVNLERFLELTRKDGQIKSRLQAAPNEAAFVNLVVLLGKEKGLEFSAADVKASFGSQRSGELSEAELEAVAGGDGPGLPMSYICNWNG